MTNGKDAYQIKIEQFEGTFDLLLFLVRDSKISLHDVSLSKITQGLLDFWNTKTDRDLDVTSDYIFKTSLLMYIKSKLLIPAELAAEEDEGDNRREFVDSLIEYQKYKNAARVLKESLDTGKVLVRRDTQQIIDFKDNDNWEEISIIDLIAAFSRVAKEVDTSVFHTLDIEAISIDDKIDDIMNFLIENNELLFHTLFGQDVTRYELIITFLALLELVKMGKIHILQHKLFGNIKILKREKAES